MGRIQSSVGLVTGIPIQDTVDKLIAISAQPRDTLTARQKDLQAQQAAVTQLTALTLGVQIVTKRLEKSDLFAGRQTTSSNADLLTATASSSAAPGQYQFVPARLAQTNQALSSGVAASDQALGGGSFSFRFGGHVDTALNLDDLNGGDGVARGQIRITDRSGASAVVDLRYVKTIDDVLAAINSADGIEVKAETVGDHLVLHDSSGGGGNLRVQEVSGGTTAADLGLSSINVPDDDAAGQNIVRLFSGLRIDQLRDGNGLSLRPALADLQVTFRDGSNPLSIDLDPTGQSAAKTLGDIISRINAADPTRLQAQISADGKRIELKDLTVGAGTFAVTSPLSGSVAKELGLTGAAVGDTITGQRLISGLKTTLIGSLNGGQGLGPLGILTLTNRHGTPANINLASAETLDEVIDTINSAAAGITASYNSAKNGITLTDTTGETISNLIAADGDATNTATKLGLVGSVAGTSINSGNLQRQVVSRSTTLSSYNGGQGVSLGSITITNSAGQKSTLNLAAFDPKTVGDLIDEINAHALGVTAQINDAGDGIALFDTAAGSGTLEVADVGGGRSAANLHIAGSGVATTFNSQPAQIIDGSTTFTIQLAAGDTLSDLVAKINDLGVGAGASVLSEGGSLPEHLSLLSGVSGKAGELLIDGSDLGLSFTDLTTGQDALLQIGGSATSGVLVSSTKNKFTSVLPGIDVTLSGASTDPVTVAVSQTSDSAASALQTFVDQYNKLRDKLDSYTTFNSSDFTTGTLFGSAEALCVDSDLSQALTATYFNHGSIHSLAELGITADDKGQLSFDKSKFQDKYNDDADGVTKFFTDAQLGVANKLDKVLESLVGENNSMLVSRAAALQKQIDDAGQRIDDWNTRLDKEKERLLNQFYTLETIVGSIRNNLNYINQIQYISLFGNTNNSSTNTSNSSSK